MSLLSQRNEVSEFRKSYRWMALFAVFVFGLLSARMFQLQVVDHDKWQNRSQENITKTIRIAPRRGLIVDQHGEVIADNRPAYKVLVTPKLFSPDRDVPRIAYLMDLDSEQTRALKEKATTIKEDPRAHQFELFSEVSRDQLAALETHLHELPALDIVTEPVREYPFGPLAAHAIGYLNEVNAADLLRLKGKGFRPGDRIGRSGLEKRYEALLKGDPGFRRVLVDAHSRAQHHAKDVKLKRDTFKPPASGHRIELSLDMQLMRQIEKAMSAYPAGAAVAVDVRTGAVRALYSKPSYDPNEMSAGISAAQYRELTNNQFRPLIDKTIYETYFPGSTFKPVTALATLESGIEHRVIDCPGYYKLGRQRFRCNARHGEVALHEALVRSCNVFFWKVAEEIGLEKINQYARLLGLNERTGIGIGTESKGFLATREWYKKHYGSYRVGYTLNTAIGQGNTRVTVLQLAMVYAAIANGGNLLRPYLVEKVTSKDGNVVEEKAVHITQEIAADQESWARIRRGLRGVVAEKKGTAHGAMVKGGASVSGKTGTAEVVGQSGGKDLAWYVNRSHGWFAGYAPSESPQIAIAVIVEHGGAGGKSAAPIGVRVLSEYAKNKDRSTKAVKDEVK